MTGICAHLRFCQHLFVILLFALDASGCAANPSLADLVGTAPSWGAGDAQATVVEFGDYQCGPCATLGKRLHTLLDERDGQLRLAFRHCPARHHPVGMRAALAAAAAHEQGRFWDVHWRLIEEGPVRDDAHLLRILEQAGVDQRLLDDELRSGRPRRVIRSDLALADRLELRGTPTIFFGDHRVEGVVTLERLRLEMGRLLASTRRPPHD